MRVLILGIDGYLGWPLALHLKARGHELMGVDDGSRRRRVRECGGDSAFDIPDMTTRARILGCTIHEDSLPSTHLDTVVEEFKPETIVYLAEQPSAPYSMIGVEKCLETIHGNVMGTAACLWAIKKHVPECHLLKLGCYDDNTEILTDDGWKLFSELDGTEFVATRTEDDRHIVFKIPKKVHSFDYEGKMYAVKSSRLDMMLTPNHRIFTAKRSNTKYGPLRLEEAESIFGQRRAYDIGAEWDGPFPETIECHGRPIDSVTFMRFLGWYLAEGHTPKARHDRPAPYKAELKQNAGDSQQRMYDVLASFAKQFGCSFNHYEEINDSGNPNTRIVLGSKDLAEYTSQFGKSGDLFIPKHIKALSPCLLREMLDSYIDGDGSEHGRGNRAFTLSRRLADDMQEVGLKCGWATTVSPKDSGWVVSFSYSTYAHVNHCPDVQNDRWEEYSGKVYCVEIGDGHGIVLVRRNGRPVWSGNTMGEWGTPNVDIPEGWFDLEFRGRTTRAMFPKCPGSSYHITKACDSLFVEFACRNWGLRSTDVMQGVVYGSRTPEMGDPINQELRTRFDSDGIFGTVISRYCAQAVLGLPITPYGAGGQTRGFLPLKDSIQCMRLAIESPPDMGQYRVVNQLEECFSVLELAGIVARCAAAEVGMSEVEVQHVDNPRKEAENHYYHPDHNILLELGYEPTGDINATIREMLVDLMGVSGRLAKSAGAMEPRVRW